MQYFLQVESTQPASSGHISEILPPTQGGGSSLQGGDGQWRDGAEGSRKESTSYTETRAVRIRKPEGLFVLDQAWWLEQDWVRK